MQLIAIISGNANTNGPSDEYACRADSVATLTCMLGKQLLEASNLCTKARKRSDNDSRRLIERQCGGVSTGKYTKNTICKASSTKKLIATWLNSRGDATTQFRYAIAG